jgi:MFS family permease
VTALIVTGYMLCGALGMLIGGFLVGRVQRLEKVISICMLGSALLLALVGTGWLPGMGAVVVASIAGLGTGWPALARHADQACAPEGATGRVYGTVYSGLDLGFCVAAPVFGWMLDHHMYLGIFFGSATALALSVVSALVVGDGVHKRKQGAPRAPPECTGNVRHHERSACSAPFCHGRLPRQPVQRLIAR